jgi:hypothetical protein
VNGCEFLYKNDNFRSCSSVFNSKAKVSNWLAEELSDDHCLNVNKDTIADISLGLSNFNRFDNYSQKG